MLLSSASVPDSHNRNVGVAEMETPKLWGNVLDPHFFISFKPLRNIKKHSRKRPIFYHL